jgi:hypothetical protein
MSIEKLSQPSIKPLKPIGPQEGNFPRFIHYESSEAFVHRDEIFEIHQHNASIHGLIIFRIELRCNGEIPAKLSGLGFQPSLP